MRGSFNPAVKQTIRLTLATTEMSDTETECPQLLKTRLRIHEWGLFPLRRRVNNWGIKYETN